MEIEDNLNIESNSKLLFSIITVCYNSSKCIEKTFNSILSQECDSYEYIVVDGLSKDNTVDIIKRYEEKFLGKMRWISEKDNGIYDAMNKAIKMSKGEYIIFINSDDIMVDGVLNYLKRQICTGEEYGLIYGNSINIYNINNEAIYKEKKSINKITKETLKKGMGVVHQSIFTHRDTFNKVGIFNKNYKVGADWDFLIRCINGNIKILYVDKSICYFSTDGISSKAHNKERHLIRKNNRLYKVIDINYLKDIISITNILKIVIGQKFFLKLQFYYNKYKKYGLDK